MKSKLDLIEDLLEKVSGHDHEARAYSLAACITEEIDINRLIRYSEFYRDNPDYLREHHEVVFYVLGIIYQDVTVAKYSELAFLFNIDPCDFVSWLIRYKYQDIPKINIQSKSDNIELIEQNKKKWEKEQPEIIEWIEYSDYIKTYNQLRDDYNTAARKPSPKEFHLYDVMNLIHTNNKGMLSSSLNIYADLIEKNFIFLFLWIVRTGNIIALEWIKQKFENRNKYELLYDFVSNTGQVAFAIATINDRGDILKWFFCNQCFSFFKGTIYFSGGAQERQKRLLASYTLSTPSHLHHTQNHYTGSGIEYYGNIYGTHLLTELLTLVLNYPLIKRNILDLLARFESEIIFRHNQLFYERNSSLKNIFDGRAVSLFFKKCQAYRPSASVDFNHSFYTLVCNYIKYDNLDALKWLKENVPDALNGFVIYESRFPIFLSYSYSSESVVSFIELLYANNTTSCSDNTDEFDFILFQEAIDMLIKNKKLSEDKITAMLANISDTWGGIFTTTLNNKIYFNYHILFYTNSFLMREILKYSPSICSSLLMVVSPANAELTEEVIPPPIRPLQIKGLKLLPSVNRDDEMVGHDTFSRFKIFRHLSFYELDLSNLSPMAAGNVLDALPCIKAGDGHHGIILNTTYNIELPLFRDQLDDGKKLREHFLSISLYFGEAIVHLPADLSKEEIKLLLTTSRDFKNIALKSDIINVVDKFVRSTHLVRQSFFSNGCFSVLPPEVIISILLLSVDSNRLNTNILLKVCEYIFKDYPPILKARRFTF